MYVPGGTVSTNFPGTSGSSQPTLAVAHDAFIARITATLTGSAPAFGITGFSPACGPVGVSVVITGASFSDVTSVTIGGVEAAFQIDSPFQITATVPPGAATGPVAVTSPQGTVVGSGLFTVTGAPSITAFSPTVGAPGTSVVITGTDLSCASAVSFGGKLATFSIDSPTQITAVVPVGAITGPITVTTPGGSATSTGIFTVQTVVNDLVTLSSMTVIRDPSPVSGGPAGTTTVRAIFTNHSSTRIEAPFFVVTELSGGNLLLNADGGPGGVGAKLTPEVGADGIIEPGESFTTDFVIGLQHRSAFTFFVDLLGKPVR